ncbi:MAG: Xaa-Pro peptidase family protein [Acidimicrobiales bacterium]
MSDPFVGRLGRVRESMASRDVDAVLLSVGADLPWLCGYEAMPLERLTMLVVRRDEKPKLLVPRLEAPRVVERPDVFDLVPWDETDDPLDMVVSVVEGADRLAIGDTTWSRFLVGLIGRLDGVTWSNASEVVGPIRAIKTPDEVERLREAAAAADRVIARLRGGEIPLVGRTEAQVSAELGRGLIEEGHDRVNFAIVAAGPNSASPHHHAGSKVIQPGEVVLCDIGGTMVGDDGVGYCSDITRCVWTGEPAPEFLALYDVLFAAHAAGVAAATVGTPCEDVDRATRRVITEGGYAGGILHRTGHGIGSEEHEDPYIVIGNTEPLTPGHAFSVEPGIYLADRWGARLEDIVVAATDGPDVLGTLDGDLAVVEA